ncbi:inactive hydroxysteroid dehydrogenase-like protein 1 [Anopheles ziemanni]|uniref:inactive hydroxysteroid dehydrogenase-like protein 1 n=1 Tax=Anopheles coustani TaxID=139045 RepID=UPI00265A66D5|nr:inactive hydroxysteroid dehydrogenase-like protein 1 [Anopheles coustani]XP_058177506.1 inactive hydroxysteroid dehydrogenase-like protein 1 [Anopheles ziemanni]
MLCTFLTAVGLYTSVFWLYENLRAPVLLILLSLKNLVQGRKLSERYGKWAVITGASDGIGKGYANYLAKKGMPVVLVARNESKLKQVADEIKSKHGVETKIVVADFSHGQEIYAHLEKSLLPLDIGILVNNVGVSHGTPKPVYALSKQQLWDLINVNVASTTLLCNILAPAMKQRGRGLIVNISSMSAVCPMPYLTAYSATKAYVTSFSVALREELKPFNVEVQTVQPGFVHTNMTDFIASGMRDKIYSRFLLGVDGFLSYAGCTLGKLDRTTGHWSHGLQTAFLYLFPEFLRTYFTGQLNKTLNEQIRASSKRKAR